VPNTTLSELMPLKSKLYQNQETDDLDGGPHMVTVSATLFSFVILTRAWVFVTWFHFEFEVCTCCVRTL